MTLETRLVPAELRFQLNPETTRLEGQVAVRKPAGRRLGVTLWL